MLFGFPRWLPVSISISPSSHSIQTFPHSTARSCDIFCEIVKLRSAKGIELISTIGGGD